ncbi:MAG: ribosome biogenesis GTP-binding protein YihA/YsxC [Pseudomonadota bacterium]
MSEFTRASFVVAAQRLEQLPPDAGREVAFAGRSNAGKSSALNAITQRQALARVSKTPGRTRQLVVFELDPDRRLVDLPGYGFAKVSAATLRDWNQTLERYFRQRQCLAGLVLIMDVRHPLREYDLQMLDFCQARALPVHVLLTKADKLKRGRARATLDQVRRKLTDEGLTASAQLFSSLKRDGVDAAQNQLRLWLDLPIKQAT